MKKITEEAKRAWDNFRPFKKSNTEVYITPQGGRILLLFGNQIAFDKLNGNEKPCNKIYWGMCAWNTVTTRERLNGILGLQLRTRRGQPQVYDKDECVWRDIRSFNTYRLDNGKLVLSIYE